MFAVGKLGIDGNPAGFYGQGRENNGLPREPYSVLCIAEYATLTAPDSE